MWGCRPPSRQLRFASCFAGGVILPAADSFCDWVMFRIVGAFQRLYNARVFVCWLQFDKYRCAEEKQQQEVRCPDSEDQTCTKEFDIPNPQEAV